MERSLRTVISPGIFYTSFIHEHPFPPVVTLIDQATRDEFRPSGIRHFGNNVEVYLNTADDHGYLEVWA